jgi:PKD repeat protein
LWRGSTQASPKSSSPPTWGEAGTIGPYALAIHPSTGDVYVGGYTSSTDFPNTTGGAQAGLRRAAWDAFVARLSADLRGVSTNQAPIASFTFVPDSPIAGESVVFDGLGSYDPDGTIVSYLWSFGDGATAQGRVVAHAFAGKGIYRVTLTVTDQWGATGTASTTVSVRPSLWGVIDRLRDRAKDIPVTVNGQQYVIATLRQKIAPGTWEPIDGSGPVRVYLDPQGNLVLDPEVVRKIGQIEFALGKAGEIAGIIPAIAEQRGLLQDLHSLQDTLFGADWVLGAIKDVATAVQYKEYLEVLIEALHRSLVQIIQIYRLSGGSPELIAEFADIREQTEITLNLVKEGVWTIDLVKAIRGTLVKGCCFLLKKLIFDPEREVHDRTLNDLDLAKKNYEEALARLGGLTEYTNAHSFLASYLSGEAHREEANYLEDKIAKKFLNVWNYVKSKALEVGLNYLTLGFWDFVKLCWEAKEAVDWEIDIDYLRVYRLGENVAILNYWLYESAPYSLELAGETGAIQEYRKKFNDAIAAAAEEASKVPEAILQYWTKGEFVRAIWDGIKEAEGKVVDFGRSVLSKVNGFLAKVWSPVELRVRDPEGRVTGVVGGQVREEIPSSFYDHEEHVVFVWETSDPSSYTCEVVGTAQGNYSLDLLANLGAEEAKSFMVSGVPISTGGTHQYLADWAATDDPDRKAPEVQVRRDEDGDGVVDVTVVARPPRQPYDPSPAPGGGGVAFGTRLSWKSGSPDQGRSVTYRVYFGTREDPPLAATLGPFPAGQSEVSWQPPASAWLIAGATYHWRVVAVDDLGFAAESPLWSFTTIVPPGALVVTAADPEPDEEGVSVGKTINITFNVPVKKRPAYKKIALLDEAGKKTKIRKKVSGATLTLDPVKDLKQGATYTLLVPEGAVRSATGPRMMNGEIRLSFTTEAQGLAKK